MAIQYGNTWWGQAYLGALTKIDYENRLARGKSYARNSRIKEILIDRNVVDAKVQGSRPKPYHVKIVHVPLLPSVQKRLTNILVDRPDLTSEILNLRLPQEIMEICRDTGVQLFPSSWRDIKLTCNCPDWAVPCKHIAAVIYTLANEIDKDPFLVFKLLKFDLHDALLKKGIVAHPEGNGSLIPPLRSLLSEKELTRGWPPFDADLFNRIDFSTIPQLGTSIPGFLDPKPVFYPYNDFRVLLEQHYKRLAQYVARLNSSTIVAPEGLSLNNLRKIDYIEMVLHEDLTPDTLWLEGADESMTISLPRLEDVIDMILSIRREEMVQLSDDFRLLHMAWEIAIHTIQCGSFIPSIYTREDSSILVHWEPYTHIASLNDMIRNFSQILRHDFLTYRDAKKNIYYMHPDKQAAILISMFINHLSKASNGFYQKYPNDPVAQLFFEGKWQSFTKFSEQNISRSIYQWLDVLFYASSGYQPRICIDENRNNKFEISISLEEVLKEDSIWISLEEFMSSGIFQPHRTHVLKMISQLGERIPALREVIRHSGKKRIQLSETEVINILGQMEGITQLTRAKIVLPKSLEKLLRPKRSLQIKKEGSLKSSGILGLNQILSFDWRIALGDQFVTPEEFIRMTENAGRMIRVNDGYVILDKEEIESLLANLGKSKAPTGAELLRYAMSQEFEGNSIEMTEDVKKWLRSLREYPRVKLPDKLNAVMRPYQINGYEWLWKNARLGFGSILADDMGLGKTLQVLVFLQKAKQDHWLKEGPALIIAPATLLTNWVKECERFTPDLIPVIYHGSKRMLKEKSFDILITTYGLARTDQKQLENYEWTVMVIDEAQNIKNNSAAQTKSILNIPAKLRIAMSGTPVENRLAEYFSISQFTNPGYLGTLSSFTKEFATPIEQHRDQHRLDVFKQMTSPFLLRRLKTDKAVISDLPDKIVINRYASLTPRQASLYEARTKEILKEIESASSDISRRGLVLKMLLQLKQICNHPYNFLKRGKKTSDLTGKSEALKEVISLIREEGRKVLIFTQYREMGDILLEMLREWGEEAMFLHGGLTRKVRDEMVTSFQQHHWPSVLILSIKAGGTGLNLTAATHVIHYDLWWNPAVEAQATDRAFRIGQKHNVTVHRIITRSTLEENIDLLIQKKKELADLTVTTGEKWIGDLTDAEIENLVKLK